MRSTRVSASTPAAEQDVLAAIYALAVQKYQESQKAAEPAPEPDGRDGTKVQGDSADDSLPH